MAFEAPESLRRAVRRWRRLVLTLALLVAQPLVSGVTPRVVVLKSSTIGPFDQATTAMLARLGQNLPQAEVLTLSLDGEMANRGAVLERIHQANPQLVITVGSLATAAVLDDPVPTSAPVLFSMVLYPRQSGFLGRPARRVTGAALDIPLEVQFRYLRRLVPAARRVGVLYHPAETGTIIEAAGRAATEQGLTLVAEPVSDPAQAVISIEPLLGKVEVIWTVADSHVFSSRTTSALMLAALRRHVPVMGLSPAHVRAGAVAALYVDYADIGEQTAEMALQLLRGVPIDAVPVSSPRRVSLALNVRTAEHLDLRIAPELEREAREVVR